MLQLRLEYDQSTCQVCKCDLTNSLTKLGGILELAVALSWGSPDFKKKLDPGMSGNSGVRPKIHGGVISNSSSDIP